MILYKSLESSGQSSNQPRKLEFLHLRGLRQGLVIMGLRDGAQWTVVRPNIKVETHMNVSFCCI